MGALSSCCANKNIKKIGDAGYIEETAYLQKMQDDESNFFVTDQTTIEEISNPIIKKIYIDFDLCPRHEGILDLGFWENLIISSGRNWNNVINPFYKGNPTNYYIYILN